MFKSRLSTKIHANTEALGLRPSPGQRNDIAISLKRNRKVLRPYDADLYKELNNIERFFNKLKQFRRVATRQRRGIRQSS
ncbi:hypothetical protein ATY76_22250 [Rhizobium sp. R339]|nr:hypothetical protein ATY76_22250 [Rhizobium sp. R339]